MSPHNGDTPRHTSSPTYPDLHISSLEVRPHVAERRMGHRLHELRPRPHLHALRQVIPVAGGALPHQRHRGRPLVLAHHVAEVRGVVRDRALRPERRLDDEPQAPPAVDLGLREVVRDVAQAACTTLLLSTPVRTRPASVPQTPMLCYVTPSHMQQEAKSRPAQALGATAVASVRGAAEHGRARTTASARAVCAAGVCPGSCALAQ